MLFNHPSLSVAGKVLGIDGLATSPIGSADPFWTIVLEWWLYVAFGVFALVLARDRHIGPSMLLLLLFALAPLLVALSTGSGLVLAWPVGMLVALSETHLRRLGRQFFVATLVLAAAAAVAVWLRSGYDFYAPAFVICLAYVLIASGLRAMEGDSGSGPPGIIRLLSNYSYSLYLVHFSVLIYLQTYMPSSLNAAAAVGVALAASNVFALGFWWAFERHYLTVRQHMLQWLR